MFQTLVSLKKHRAVSMMKQHDANRSDSVMFKS